jgi:hypothetical protein
MSTSAIALPPGATLESADDTGAQPMRLPPGAELESGSVPQAQQPQVGSISAVHEPDSISGKVAKWAENVSNDI